jgi:hypothetical protein
MFGSFKDLCQGEITHFQEPSGWLINDFENYLDPYINYIYRYPGIFH